MLLKKVSLSILCTSILSIIVIAQSEPLQHRHNSNSNIKGKIEEEESILIIKIGGSSITEKSKYETLNLTSIEWFSDAMSSSSLKNEKMIIIHGAGSFGHHHAKQHGFKGVSSPPSSLEASSCESTSTISNTQQQQQQENEYQYGIAQTRLSVQKLHLELLSNLIKKNLNAVGLSPFSTHPIYHKNDELPRLEKFTSSVDEILQAGLIPVIHGDAVVISQEEVMKGAILGGDDLVHTIATHYNHKKMNVRVVFITDVDGVFTKDPRLFPPSEAKLVPHIEISPKTKKIISSFAGDIEASKSHHTHDVTGGLEAKLKSAIEISSLGIPVLIVKCSTKSAELALQPDFMEKNKSNDDGGAGFRGTLITLQTSEISTSEN